MSLLVFVAHSGQRLEAAPVVFSSLDALKSWINNATKIPPPDQILLTPRGKHKEIFLYDRDLFALPAPQDVDAIVPPAPSPEPFVPANPPDTLENPNVLSSWQDLYRARRDWALNLQGLCRGIAQSATLYIEELAVVERGVRVAASNHEAHIQSLEQKQAEARAWFEAVAKEQEECLKSWEADLVKLKAIPAREPFKRFLATNDDTPKKMRKGDARTTLDTFANAERARRAASLSNTVLEELGAKITDMDNQIDRIRGDYNQFQEAIDQSQSRSQYSYREEPQRLMEEVDVIVKKVASDYEHVLGLPASPKSTTQVSKMALLHTRSYLPNLAEVAKEISECERRAVEQKNHAVRRAIEHMQTIATIESTLASANQSLSSIDIAPESQEALEALSIISKVPYIYGVLLIEGVRRHEWAERLRKDSSTLVEEIAGYREEEDRRRKRWLKNNSDVINVDAAHDSALGIDINVRGQDVGWPMVTRQEFQDYLSLIGSIGGFEQIVEPLVQLFKDLDRPTRQQIKHAKGFKTGSIHEATLGKGSLLMRGENETRVLRETMAKMEEELKGSKSRVRKLEDLLHRQSTISRLSIASGGAPPPSSQTPDTPTMEPYPTASSPRPQENLSRHSSVSSRRYSATRTADEKALVKRIAQLEAELATERDARMGLEKEHSARHDDLQRHVDERTSTNKDLMENMESMQKDWAEERRSLEAEMRRLKYRNEELEEELDRNLGSRDNERVEHETRTQSIEADMEQLRKEVAGELESEKQRAEKATIELQELQQAIQEREAASAERHTTLVNAFTSLSKDDPLPDSSALLAAELEKVALRSKEYARELAEAVEKARAENDALTSAAAKQRNELEADIKSREADIFKKSNELAAESARALALANDLKDERGHLEDLRAKFAEGEAGAETLRQRVSEEESKVERLSLELAEAKAHVESLQKSLDELQDKHNSLQASSTNGASLSELHAKRTRELSEKLLANNDRLHRLLENLGFVVTHQDNHMVIHRASKMASISTVLPDGSVAMARSQSNSLMSKKLVDEGEIESLLKWTQQDGADDSAGYASFLEALSRFDVELFSDTITKRMRDMEHTARKWQREARTYRDKSHRYQSEAHEKIAIRGFKEGDLALFLPTRNQATRPWAAFNVGAPHYFLHEQESHRLHNKEWLVARITKVEERVVDLSKTMDGTRGINSDRRSITSERSGISFEDDNPFELSDGLRWHLVEAAEEKVGAPLTPGLGKVTVDSTKIDARGSIRMKKGLIGNDASKTLNKSLDSRRSSGTSKRSVPAATTTAARNGTTATTTATAMASGPEITNGGSSNDVTTAGSSSSSTAGPGNQTHVGDANGGEDNGDAAIEQTDFASSPIVTSSTLSTPTLSQPPPPSSSAAATPTPSRAQQALASASSSVPTASSVPHRLRSERADRRSASASSDAVGKSTQGRGADAPVQGQAPAEEQPKRRSGFFDSLWSLDISYERGRGRD
ncbi:autophagy-related protein 11-domain-containing protein [Phyllosticta citribraziliensis]